MINDSRISVCVLLSFFLFSFFLPFLFRFSDPGSLLSFTFLFSLSICLAVVLIPSLSLALQKLEKTPTLPTAVLERDLKEVGKRERGESANEDEGELEREKEGESIETSHSLPNFSFLFFPQISRTLSSLPSLRQRKRRWPCGCNSSALNEVGGRREGLCRREGKKGRVK